MDKILTKNWHVASKCIDVKDNDIKTVTILDEEIILWRKGGKVMAWQNLCVHRGTRLSLGKICNGNLQCGYHGWLYNEEGKCIKIPACPDLKIPERARVKTYQVIEKAGLVFVSLSEEPDDFPDLPILDDPAFNHMISGPYELHASGPRIIENFLDISHFPFVHEGYLGDPAYAEMPDYTVEKTKGGLIAKNMLVYQPDPYGTGEPGYVNYEKRVYQPLTAGLKVDGGEGKVISLIFLVTPVSETDSVAFGLKSMNYPDEMTEEEFLNREDLITGQDIPVVESQRPELLPLDLQSEIHARIDQLSIAYRRYLQNLGLSFGTS